MTADEVDLKLLQFFVGNVDVGEASEASVDAINDLLFDNDSVNDRAGFTDEIARFGGQLYLRSPMGNFENLGEGERPRLDGEHVDSLLVHTIVNCDS